MTANAFLVPGFLSQALTYGFRIGSTQIAGRPDIESLIHEDSESMILDPATLADSLKASRGASSYSQTFDCLPVMSKLQKLSSSNDEELGLVGPFREQSLDRPKRLQELAEILKSRAHFLDERIDAIRELATLATGEAAGTGVCAIMEFLERPEAGRERGLRKRVVRDLLRLHAFAAMIRFAKRGEIEDRKGILEQVIGMCLNQYRRVSLVHLEEDWLIEDPHRVAPFLIDLNRPERLLLGELIIRLTEGLDYDARKYEDHDLYNRISHARQILQANEIAVRKYLKAYDPKPYRPAPLAWLRNLLIPSSRKAHRDQRLAAVLQEFRDLYVELPAQPEMIFRHYPFAYDTSSARKRLKGG